MKMKNMSVEEMMLHPIQLKDVIVSEVQLRNISGRRNVPYDVKTNVKGHGELVKPGEGYTFLELDIKGYDENNDVAYELLLKLRGFCILDENSNASDDEYVRFLSVQCLPLLWPYVRENVPGLLWKMGVDLYEIPTIHSLNTMKKNIEE